MPLEWHRPPATAYRALLEPGMLACAEDDLAVVPREPEAILRDGHQRRSSLVAHMQRAILCNQLDELQRRWLDVHTARRRRCSLLSGVACGTTATSTGASGRRMTRVGDAARQRRGVRVRGVAEHGDRQCHVRDIARCTLR